MKHGWLTALTEDRLNKHHMELLMIKVTLGETRDMRTARHGQNNGRYDRKQRTTTHG